MQIHVIQPGQTLFGIAEAYDSTISEIMLTNKIINPNALVVGQALVIPIAGHYYWVQPGDTLYIISGYFGINYQVLAKINGIALNTSLQVGLRLYIPPAPKINTEINGYIQTIGGKVPSELAESNENIAPLLTYLAPFSFQIQRDGSLQPPPSPEILPKLKNIAAKNNVTLMMVFTNIEGRTFSTDLGRIILTDEQVQDNLIENIISTAKQYGFRDIHFDLEYLPINLKENYNNFLRKVKAQTSKEGFLLSTALAPKLSNTQKGLLYEAHDYKSHGEIVDFVVLMTYEWGYTTGPPMAVSPIGPVRQVIEYALTEMPSSKIMMGQNLYGYDWTLPYIPRKTYAKSLSPDRAIEIAAENNASINYDYNSQAPYFNYKDVTGNDHIVWFEDARSIQAKFNLVKELMLRGVSYWKLGLSFPQNWLLIQDNFDVIKNSTP
ncbi:glycoside hydrolase family 18 protein [Clostridium sp. SHJSY1]|uniref:glycoside hydrolase family 18 protein n=1 Tax=Clostridium sp. SHJSY1 TaxID=2942483 RepID=UPI0028748271|nr:glycoside hydrolase family 18 protein [Clostridium sp. SHJSY1]MDS0526137.1 glycoside hydrolase family 18 protein [Clostridium sp. SHJSY1]